MEKRFQFVQYYQNEYILNDPDVVSTYPPNDQPIVDISGAVIINVPAQANIGIVMDISINTTSLAIDISYLITNITSADLNDVPLSGTLIGGTVNDLSFTPTGVGTMRFNIDLSYVETEFIEGD